ncbi:MAG: SH3 domain-containing protein [Bacteroidota bacterium]
MISKLNLKLFFLFLVISRFAAANELNQGDSLFVSQKYTEALDVYQELFDTDRYTYSMLLKMAFINDGLGNYPQALYYLDLYYKKTADRSVVAKINEISEENSLSGYQYNDTHFFLALMEKYQAPFQLVLFSFILLLMAYAYRKRQKKEQAAPAVVLQFVLVIVLLIVNNQVFDSKQGIIGSDQTLLRSGPSAGAEPVEVLSRGHKVKVLEELPVWTKIAWDDEEVYVRKGKVLII